MKISKKIIAFIIILCMMIPVISLLPHQKATAANTAGSSSPISAETYSELGFNTMSENEYPTNEKLKRKYSVSNIQNELYVHVNADEHNGTILRDNLTFQEVGRWEHDSPGAIKTYGDLTAKLSSDKGNNYGYLDIGPGNHTLYSSFSQGSDKMENKAYATSVALRSLNSVGTDDLIATLEVKTNTTKGNRPGFNIALNLETFKGGTPVKSRSTTLEVDIHPTSMTNTSSTTLDFQNLEYDALIEITAGDYNGDGKDEIAVYYGTGVIKIYRIYSDNSVSLMTTIGTSLLGSYTYDAPGITMSSGDMNGDGKEELAVALSHHKNPNNQATDIINHSKAYIFSYNGSTFSRDYEYSLNQGSSGIIRNANVYMADVTGDGLRELFVAGYLLTPASGTTNFDYNPSKAYKQFATVGITCSGGIYESTGLQMFASYGGNSGTYLSKEQNGYGRYGAPIGLGVANLGPQGSTDKMYAYIDEQLYLINPTGLSFTLKDNSYLTYTEDPYTRGNDDTDKRDRWVSSVTVGNFNGSEDGRQQILVVTGLRAKGTQQKYWYQLSWYSLDGETLKRGHEMIMASSLSYNNSTTERNNSCFVAIAAPDVNDDDTLILERIGDVQRYYTKPSINSIIQAAPYFEDLSSDSYPNEGGTEFGSSTGSTQSGLASCGVSASIKGEIEAEAAITVDLELSSTFAFDYNFEHIWTNETAVTFGGGTDDYVIMYTIPYSVYTYKMLVSESKRAKVPGTRRYNDIPNYSDALLRAKSEMDTHSENHEDFMAYAAWVELNTSYLNKTPQQLWQTYKPGSQAPKSYFYFEIEEPCNPVTTILTVDQYDEIASRTDGLETIRGTYLNSTPGDPASYANIPTSYHSIKRVDEFRQVGNAEGGYISVEYSVGTEEAHSFEFSYEFESSCMIGAGALGCKAVAGFAYSLSGGGGYAYSDSVGNTYSGTVDSLPKDATDYDFYWQLCKATATINGKEVDIVYYDVKNVRSLPKTPQNLTVSDVSADSVTLTWDNNSTASRYEIYAVNGNQSLFLDTVTAGTSSDSLSYESEGLNSATAYYYKIRAVNNSGLKSRFSSTVSATTLPDSGGSFGISQQPEDFETFAGDVAIFTVVAYTTNSKPIQYQWQTYDSDAKIWTDMDGKRSATLKVDAIPDRDGSRYRCVVYQGAGCIVYSSAVELVIGKTGSNTKLTIAKNTAGNTIPDGSTVNCSGEIRDTQIDSVYEWVADIRTVGENNYTKLAYSEILSTESDPVYEPPFVFVSDEGSYYSVTDDDEIGEEITQQAGFYNGSENFLLKNDGTPATHTGYYEKNVVNIAATETDVIEGTEYTFTKMIVQATCTDPASDATASYTAYSFDDTTDEGTERRIFYRFECGSDIIWKELDVEATNSHDAILINQDGTDREPDEYKTVKVYREIGTNTVVDVTPVDGDVIFLKASSNSATTNEAVSFDSYTFVIRNAETGSVVFNNTVTENHTEYTFTDPGVYEITVSASGNDNYRASTSEKSVVYVVNKPEIGNDNKLIIAGSNIKYGERLALNPVIITNNSGSDASNVNYTVMYGNSEATGLIDNDTFTPDKAGVYIITAECDGLTTGTSINVEKRDIKVSVLNCEAPCNASESDKISYISYDVEGDIDNIWADEAVTATSEAFTATTADRYPINLEINTNASVYTELDSKYDIRLNGATYTLTSPAYKVTVETENKGTSDISYLVAGADEPSFASSGDYIASGADVTVTALPNNGYVFRGWMKNGENVSVNAVYEIASISEDTNLKAVFEPVEHTKNYIVDYGTLTVGYTSNEINANPTVTGDKVLVKDSDYIITYYKIDESGVITQQCNTPVNIGRYLFVMSTVGSEISSAYGFEGGVPESVTGENADEFIETFKCANILTVTDTSGAHVHSYTAEVTTPPTCTETGVKTFTCECGESYTETIPAAGHLFSEWTDVVSQTCGGESYSIRVCSECGAEEKINVHTEGHAWETEYTTDKEPTCTEEGSKSIHCSRCDATQFSTAIPATGHSFGEPTEVVSETCGGDSYSVITCSVCGVTETTNIHPESHAWETEFTTDKEATCTEDGSKSIHCAKCDAKQFSTVIPATGHSFSEWEDVVSETCGGESYSVRTCSCGAVEKVNVHTEGHAWDTKYTTDKEATCTEDGSKSIHCTKCDATQFSTVIPATGHSFDEVTEVISETCGGDSYTVRKCSVCRLEENINIHPESHAWDTEYTTDKEPTCTEDGSKSIHCTKCDAKQFSTAIPATGHSFGEWEEVVSETCGGDSYSVRKCSVCGVEESINIHAESHAWDTKYTTDKEATCTENGSKSIHCTKCDATQYNDVIPAKGHSAGEWEIETPATETKSGKEVRKCTVCGEVIDSREIPATVGHSHSFSYKITTPATCVEDGVITFSCSCGESYTVSQFALGHTDGNNDGRCDRCGFIMNENATALESMVINVPENTKVEWKQSTTVVVTASAVPADCELVLYYNKERVAKKPDKNGNVTIEQDLGKLQKETEISVVAEKNGYIQSNSNGLMKKDFTISVKASFFDKIVSFFKTIFGLLKPVVIEPGK